MFQNIVNVLALKGQTIATMESCTGGKVVSEITNVEGASTVLKFSAVTYSNEFKIKMGVEESILRDFTVYSMETAREMSKKISVFAGSHYGVGITGRMNAFDAANPVGGDESTIYISVYQKDTNQYFEKVVQAIYSTREENKIFIAQVVVEILENILDLS